MPSGVIESSACRRDTWGSTSTRSHDACAPTTTGRAPSATTAAPWSSTCKLYERGAVRLRVLSIARPVWISVRRSNATPRGYPRTMNDTLAAMRVLALAVALCACGDDISLRVVVHHPAGVTIALTKVTIYESASLTCTDVSLARVGADELDAVRVAEQSVDADGNVDGTLDDISRVDHKVIVARGFSEAGAWITAGCEEHDVVQEATKIVIDTIPTVTASPVLDVDMTDPLLAVLATTDQSGMAVTDRRVAWTVYGPAGSQPMQANNVAASDGVWEPTKPACTQAKGAAALHPPPPSVVGGYAVQLRAEWS